MDTHEALILVSSSKPSPDFTDDIDDGLFRCILSGNEGDTLQKSVDLYGFVRLYSVVGSVAIDMKLFDSFWQKGFTAEWA